MANPKRDLHLDFRRCVDYVLVVQGHNVRYYKFLRQINMKEILFQEDAQDLVLQIVRGYWSDPNLGSDFLFCFC